MFRAGRHFLAQLPFELRSSQHAPKEVRCHLLPVLSMDSSVTRGEPLIWAAPSPVALRRTGGGVVPVLSLEERPNPARTAAARCQWDSNMTGRCV